MNIYIFPKVHSLIDVITNSSTELFITEKGKTIEFVNEVLSEIGASGIGTVYELTEENFEEYFERVIIGYGSGVEEIPDTPDYFYIREKYCYRCPWVGNEEFNNSQSDMISAEWDNALVEWKEKYYKLIKEEYLGRIVIEGDYDNSIPYEIWDLMKYKLDAVSIHLG